MATDYSLKVNMLGRPKAIREKCMDCSGWNAAEVRMCPVKHCALWPYRMGKDPLRAGGKGNTAGLEKWRASRRGATQIPPKASK